MIIDGNALGAGPDRRYDLCIVGSGPAGMTLARQLADQRLKVCVLEAGAASYTEDSQSFYKGSISAEAYDDLDVARLRLLGGTSGHWAGLCAPLDPIDFSRREWVPDSGWPIDAQTLAPYYRAARDILDLPVEEEMPGALAFRQGRLQSKQWVLSPPTRFAQKYRDWFEKSEQVDLYLNCTVIEFQHDDAGQRLLSVQALNNRKSPVTFNAERFVLACGGIENARLLLTGSPVFARQPGADHTGRYFMEHPHFLNTAEIALPASDAIGAYLRTGGRYFKLLQISPAMQGTLQVNNMACELRHELTGERDGQISTGTFTTGTPDSRLRIFSLIAMLEQSPYRESRVALSGEKDAHGIPRVDLQWRVHPRDYESLIRSLKFMATELGLTGMGRMRITQRALGEDLTRLKYWGHHHMGTTRMADSPATGVVDADCRHFGTHNLYIAGSSVYPTVGCVNPTYTLVALALRLADHLAD